MKTTELRVERGGVRWLRLSGIVVGITLFVLAEPASLPMMEQAVARAAPQGSSFEEEMTRGRDFLRRRRYEEALKSFKRANELRDKKSPEALLAMANAYQGLEAYKNVAESCEKAIELAAGNVAVQVQAYNLKGIALQAQAENQDQKKLKDAEASFRQGLDLNAGLHVLHYNLGLTLLQQGRDPEGVAELKTYLELAPKAAEAAEARKMIENPRRAREAYAPEFSITTSEGEYHDLEELRGKVVLLDFWATWCGPCVAALPSLKSLHKKFQKEPAFVIIGISADSEGEKWRAFISQNKMIWPQYWDRDRRVQRAFAIRAYPTYVLIDHEGIVRFRNIGSSWERTGALDEAIRKHVKMAAKMAAQ